MHGLDGIMPTRATLDLEIGNEIVLVIRDPTSFIRTLQKTEPINLRMFGGIESNTFGCVGFFLFWIPVPLVEQVPLALYDFYINLYQEASLAPLRELANQTHWHLFIVDQHSQQRRFIEFRNTFRLNEIIETMQKGCANIPAGDFDKAKTSFMARRTLNDLFCEGPTKSTVTEEGLSIFHDTYALPATAEDCSPLRKARFVGLFHESVSHHRANPSVSHFDYTKQRLQRLFGELGGKQVIYLDVCHWINLRHVWLQSALAQPTYDTILRLSLGLLNKGAILCPVSGPIFQELMKQSDPKSRAATANLIELFSHGVTLVPLEEAFVHQCYGFLVSKDGAESTRSWRVSKIGLWFDDRPVKSAWWSEEIADIWDKVSVDLRWELRVCDCQELVGRGHSPVSRERPFFEKWASLPAQQKRMRRSFRDLTRECRLDLAKEFRHDAVERLEPVLGKLIGQGWLERLDTELATFGAADDFGKIPCCEILAGMCAAQVFRGGKIRPNDLLDFLHASMGIPASAGYFCDKPMECLARNKLLNLDKVFGVKVSGDPLELLGYLKQVDADMPAKSQGSG